MSVGDSLNVSNLNLKPASIHRYFIHAPCGAEWASKNSSFFGVFSWFYLSTIFIFKLSNSSPITLKIKTCFVFTQSSCSQTRVSIQLNISRFHKFIMFQHAILSTEFFRVKMCSLAYSKETVQHFSIFGNRTLELCIAKWWSSLGDVQAHFELSFKGLTPLPRSIAMVEKIKFIDFL